jgi:hypothetical protein
MKRQRSPNKTRLWFVSLSWGPDSRPVILVSPEWTRQGGGGIWIRTISARAAGRRYQRNNMARQVAIWFDETDNEASPTYMEELTPKRIKQWGQMICKGAKIKVL